MTAFYQQEFDSEEEYLLEELNDNSLRQYVVDINYNRPLKNFPQTLNKIDEVDETATSVRSTETNDENGNPVQESTKETKNMARNYQQDGIGELGKKRQRPKSASCVVDSKKAGKAQKQDGRPRSSCANYPSRIPISKKTAGKGKNESRSLQSGGFDPTTSMRFHRSSERLYSDEVPTEDPKECCGYHERPTCPCWMRPVDDFSESRTNGIRRSNSQPNIFRRGGQKREDSQSTTAQPKTWCEVTRFKRSLRLLGLSSSDFGLPESPKVSQQLPPRPRSSYAMAPTFSTKVLERSISLDSLKEIIRESSGKQRLGLIQRQLLAQAAYEEWYFKKTSESQLEMKIKQENVKKKREEIDEESTIRQEKAREKYRQWLAEKKLQEKRKSGKKLKVEASLDNRLLKSKEDIDKAYLEWKRKKQKDMERQKEKKQLEIEKENREKAQKEEKRQLAEKVIQVFKEWKKKLEETEKERKESEKIAKNKIKVAMTTRSTKTNKSFEDWKENKENEIKARWKNLRHAAKQADEVRSMQLTERMYEAEEAFEEWLDKVDNRTQKQLGAKTQIVRPVAPWAPA